MGDSVEKVEDLGVGGNIANVAAFVFLKGRRGSSGARGVLDFISSAYCRGKSDKVDMTLYAY